MKKLRYTDQQIAQALRQTEQGTAVAKLRRVKQVEEENRGLKQVVADLTLDKAMLQDLLQKKA
jgi:putative transposase